MLENSRPGVGNVRLKDNHLPSLPITKDTAIDNIDTTEVSLI